MIRPPFYKKLVRRAIDKEIDLRIRREGKWLDDLVSYLQDKGFSEKTIRNRIEALEKINRIRKVTYPNGRVFISARKSNMLNTPNIAPKSVQQKVEEYIHSISVRLDHSTKVDHLATEAAGRVINSPTIIGFRPRNLAAAIIYLIAKRNGLNIPAETISSIARVSKPSIYIRAKDIARILQQEK